MPQERDTGALAELPEILEGRSLVAACAAALLPLWSRLAHGSAREGSGT